VRAIIIDDAAARALLDQLTLEKFQATDNTLHSIEVAIHRGEKINPQWVVSEVHRHFHYVVTRWLQEQGAQVVR
jgi:hypothetical protein